MYITSASEKYELRSTLPFLAPFSTQFFFTSSIPPPSPKTTCSICLIVAMKTHHLAQIWRETHSLLLQLNQKTQRTTSLSMTYIHSTRSSFAHRTPHLLTH